MTIHTFGDSHSHTGWIGVEMHWLGPVLCYSFGKEKLNRCDISKKNIKHGDTVIFCFGEIDVRNHIKKHITDTVTYQDIIDSLVKNYFDAIELNVINSGLKLKNVCVYNIPPTCSWIETLDQNDPKHPELPWLGNKEERKSYALYFNIKLREKCLEKGYIFFDIYNKCCDENGFLRHDLSDTVHVTDSNILSEFIKEHNL
jgi:hypothetical protein